MSSEMRVLGVGIDPGKTSGIGCVELGLGGNYSLLHAEELGWEEALERSGVGLEEDWWTQCAAVGSEIAGWIMCFVEDWLGTEDDCVCVVRMEDFVLSPFAGSAGRGIGGRDVVVPVGVGVGVVWQLREYGYGADVRQSLGFGMPSSKGVINDEWLKRCFGRIGGKGHSKDAVRHAVIGIRDRVD